nr:unnamed protein product [Spirometra erinaceieuropaei]
MFADSPLPLDRILQTCLSFIQGTPVGVCASMFGLSESTVVDWYALCGKVCSKALLREASSPLGGPGVEMQVDEFLLKKYEFGIGSPESQDWLIGMYDTAQRRAVFERVEDRRADCLIPVIRKWIAVGSVVVTDDWEGYHSLTSLGYTHTAIKRSKNFVDPVTGKHMNGVKAYWSNLKKRVRRSEPVNERNIWSHLEEAKYRKWYGLKSDIFPAWDLFVSHIAQLYPVEENPALQSP